MARLNTPLSIMASLTMIVGIGLLVTLGATLLGFWGQNGGWLDLFSHFRLQYLLISLVGLAWMGLQRHKLGLTVALASFVLNGLQILPYYLFSPPANRQPVVAELKLLHANVLVSNYQYQPLINLIKQENPDVISLNEIDQDWVTALTPILQRYPYRVVAYQNEGSFGVGLYSRFPLKNGQVRIFTLGAPKSIVAEMDWGEQPVALLSTHPVPPMSEDWFALRNQQLMAIAEARSTMPASMILAGDLNTTPWSYPFQAFLDKTRLWDSAQGRGVQPSWPTFVGGLPWIPIDHVLVSEDIAVLERRVGPAIGSDHLPVIVTLGLTR